MTRRVVITGLGTVNGLAHNVPAYWKALLAGRSGVSRIEQFDTSAFKVHFGGEVKGFDGETMLEGESPRRLDRYAQFGLAAAIGAVKDSGIDFKKEDPFRCGVILGSGIGGLNEFEEQHTRLVKDGPPGGEPANRRRRPGPGGWVVHEGQAPTRHVLPGRAAGRLGQRRQHDQVERLPVRRHRGQLPAESVQGRAEPHP